MSKFNKKKCKKCIYGGTIGTEVCCDYSLKSKECRPSLRYDAVKRVVDIRGNGHGEPCALFVEEKPIRKNKNIVLS